MAEELVNNFSSVIFSLERETKVLKSVMNLKSLLSSDEILNNKKTVNKLKSIEAIVESLEIASDDFENFLDSELVQLNNLELLKQEAIKQVENIKILENSMPKFLINNNNNDLNNETTEVIIKPVDQKEFDSVPSSTKGRLTFQQINEAVNVLNNIFRDKAKVTS